MKNLDRNTELPLSEEGNLLAWNAATDPLALLIEDHTVESTLERLVGITLETIEAADVASVSIVEGGVITTVKPSGPAAQKVDELQYGTGEGPCLEAIRELDVVLVTDLVTDERWPRFSAKAEDLGVGSCVAAPIHVGDRLIGALNAFSGEREAFSPLDRLTAEILATQAGIGIANALSFDESLTKQQNLRRALESRDEIATAKGILAERERVTSDEAFQLLVDASQRLNVKLRDVARRLVEDADRRYEKSN